jgi:hypothetical protein
MVPFSRPYPHTPVLIDGVVSFEKSNVAVCMSCGKAEFIVPETESRILGRRMRLPFETQRCINDRMSIRRHKQAGLWVPILMGLLILGIVTAELPELLSLVDNTSNDFVVRKIGQGGGTPRLATAVHASALPDRKGFGCHTTANCLAALVGTETISGDLFLLHSVLRR